MENNDDQQSKQQEQTPKQQLPLNMLDQLQTDRAMAAALQQQESAITMLETIESEVEDEENEEYEDEEEEIGSSSWTSSQDYDDNNFESQEFEAEFEFTEEDDDEGSYMEDEIEEDDIDPDEMSYEELIALGEIVGEANRGLSLEQINASLSPYVHKVVQCKTIIDRCVICQIEYEEAELLVALQCQHPFHSDCINQWLQIKKVCPICSVEVTPATSNTKTPPTNPDKI